MKSQEQMNVSPNYMTYNGNHLFHFTSFSSSIRIISSNCLIFGDFKNMNDISESGSSQILVQSPIFYMKEQYF